MKYLLDTNVWVDYLNGRHPSVVRKIQACSPADLGLSTIVVAEIPLLEFDVQAAASYGRLRALLEKGGVPIGPNDTLIAAQALARKLVVVTDNTTEFARAKGLKLENWREDGR